jgi:hypothetical protein
MSLQVSLRSVYYVVAVRSVSLCHCFLGYMPPEMVYLSKEPIVEKDKNFARAASVARQMSVSVGGVDVGPHGVDAYKWRAKVKYFPVDDKDNIIADPALPYGQVKADPSYDIWCFGVLMYFMCMKENLWLENISGDIREQDLVRLGQWTTHYKSKVLSRISNPNARNLIAQLLSKDPTMRPSATRILAHPFISGRSVARMVGEDAAYDVFISYRVKSEKEFAAALYHELTKRGLKCYLDKFCLKQGVSWEQGFCDGLAQSLTFVPLLSRHAINHPEIARQNFSKLREDSAIDNVFLEHRLALELEVVGLLEKILPVQIGDKEDGAFTSYSSGHCAPTFPPNCEVVVHSVEMKLIEHLDRLGLGTPIHENQTVKQVFDSLMKHQAFSVSGEFDSALLKLSESIVNMVADSKETAKQKSLNKSSSMDADTEAEAFDLELDLNSARFDPTEFSLSSFSRDTLSGEDFPTHDGPFSPAVRHGVKSTLLMSREKRISELEEENKALRAENERLRLQLQNFIKK